MTLNLTIINQYGAWQCSDHRLTNIDDGGVPCDFSVKHIIFRCKNGAALLAYAGIGRFQGEDISDWIRKTLRGESRTIDELLIKLKENATQWLGPLCKGKHRHMFTVAAFINKCPWIAQIRNFETPAIGEMGPPTANFETIARQVNPNGEAFAFPDCISQEEINRLALAAQREPRKTDDLFNLLAAINRKAANRSKGISKHCVTTYLPPEGEPYKVKFHDLEGAPAAFAVPLLFFGIDLTESDKLIREHLHSTKDNLQPVDEEALKKAMTNAVQAKNPLYPSGPST